VDVVLHADEADHPAVALERVERAQYGGHQLRGGALALEPQQHAVEDGQLLASVLQVDRNELGGDLELHQRSRVPSPGFTDR